MAAPPAAVAGGGKQWEMKESDLKIATQVFMQGFLDTCRGASMERELDEEVKQFYMAQMDQMLEQSDRVTLYIDFKHLENYDPVASKVIIVEWVELEPAMGTAIADVLRSLSQERAEVGTVVPEDDRLFAPSIFNLGSHENVRSLRTELIKRLVCISGTVTRTSQVRPELREGRFICGLCSEISDYIPQDFRYTTPMKCRAMTCENRTNWRLNPHMSRFSDWQKVKVQENADEIPSGSMPRSMDVILRGELVERCKAGDKVLLTGSLIVIPEVGKTMGLADRRELLRVIPTEQLNQTDSANPGEGIGGLKNLGVRSLNHRMAFWACCCHSVRDKAPHRIADRSNDLDDSEEADEEELTETERETIQRMLADPRLADKLAKCIAPNIKGYTKVKKALLYMLFGGVHKRTWEEGLSIRGDINVLLIGDPSLGKSQFLKYVKELIPRTVYTSGKASTAAGLTASVIRDTDTKEFGIEAGALMLADNGICCIDEFDKMDPDDQVAIHEAMEQQTISIAKAGIKATLNARTSVLAAANPRGSRYDGTKQFHENTDLTGPIISRFDLKFALIDRIDQETDKMIANHVLDYHCWGQGASAYVNSKSPYSAEEFKLYRRWAKRLQPMLRDDAMNKLNTAFADLRDKGRSARSMKNPGGQVTIRKLESLIRLAEARARVCGRSEVTQQDATEAISLMRHSELPLFQDPTGMEGQGEEAEFEEADRDTIRQTVRRTLQGDRRATMDELLQETMKELTESSEGAAERWGELSKSVIETMAHDSVLAQDYEEGGIVYSIDQSQRQSEAV